MGDGRARTGRGVRQGVEGGSRALRPEHQGDHRVLRPQLQELVDKQVELAKTELAPVGQAGRHSGGLARVGAVFMLVFLIFISLTGVYVLDLFLPLWVSALIVSVILLLIGGILAGAGANILAESGPQAPPDDTPPSSRT